MLKGKHKGSSGVLEESPCYLVMTKKCVEVVAGRQLIACALRLVHVCSCNALPLLDLAEREQRTWGRVSTVIALPQTISTTASERVLHREKACTRSSL